MLSELLVATLMVVATTLMHVVGLMLASWLLERRNRKNKAHRNPGLVQQIYVPVCLVLGLMVLHGLEIWAYALVFVNLHALEDMRSAVYFSTISYAAIGYSDAAIEKQWALVAAIEGINGLVLLGWSTAFLVTRMSRLHGRPHDSASDEIQ